MIGKYTNITLLVSILLSVFAIAFSAYPSIKYQFKMFTEPRVLGKFTAHNWHFDQVSRFWSARIYGVKIDGKCDFRKGQVVRAYGMASESAPQSEIVVNFLDDDTADSSRPDGFHDFGRWEFQEPNLFKGFILRVRVEHFCPHREKLERNVVTYINPFYIGKDG